LTAAGDSGSCAGIASASLGTLLLRLFVTGFPEMLDGVTQILLEVGMKRHVRS
jgi:hypothetical protein